MTFSMVCTVGGATAVTRQLNHKDTVKNLKCLLLFENFVLEYKNYLLSIEQYTDSSPGRNFLRIRDLMQNLFSLFGPPMKCYLGPCL